MIEIYVSGNEIKQSGQNCGVCGEGNSTEMHLIFGSDWDSYSKRVVFYDAHGQTPTAVLISGSSAIQTISIPFEPLKYEGDIEYVIEGSKENTKKKSVAGRLRVRYAPMTEGAGAPEDVTPTQAEQLQILIAAAESAAKEYADTKAETAEGNAKAYADSKAQAAETAAKEYADGKAGAALTSAKEYADTKADGAESAAKQYADTKAETAEGNAKEYADSKASVAETAAKEYADGKADAALAAAKSYTDGKANAAEKNAKAYADSIKPTKVSELENDSGYLNEHQSLAGYATEKYADNAAAGAETAAKSYTDSIKPTKVSELENDSGYLPSADAIGKKGVGTGAEIFNDYENNKASGYCHAEGCATEACVYGYEIAENGLLDTEIRLKSNKSDYSDINLKVGDYLIFYTEDGSEHSLNPGIKVTDVSALTTVGAIGVNSTKGLKDFGVSPDYIGTSDRSNGNCVLPFVMGAHTEGYKTKAIEVCTHAEGTGTIASVRNQHVQGKYNEIDTERKFAHIVGNGYDEDERSNAHTVDWNGVGWFAGGLKVGGSGQYDGAAKDIATVEQVTTKANETESAAKSYADTKLEKKVDKEKDYTLSKVRDLELSNKDDYVTLEVTKTSNVIIVEPTNPIEPTSDSVDETESISTYSSSSVGWEIESCSFYNTEQANNKNAETLAAAKNYTDTKLKGKADRYAISASVTGNTLLLADKSDTQLLSAAAAALTLTLPETVTSGYECFFSFKSGATATTLTVPSGITWTGADCNSDKEFVPLANTVYEVGIRCIGFSSDGTPYLSARVGVC